MTLVVARKFGATTWLVADTLVSGGPLAMRDKEYCLKLIFLNPRMIVGFSGPPDDSYRLLHQAAMQAADESPRNVANIISQLVRENRVESDFIIVRGSEIYSVKHGRPKQVGHVEHVGQSFNRYQRYYTELREGNSIDPSTRPPNQGQPAVMTHIQITNLESACGADSVASEQGRWMHAAMERLIGDLEAVTIGGSAVVAVSGPSDARYLLFSTATSPEFSPVLGRTSTVDFGTAANGGYCFTSLTPSVPGKSGWGAFFHQGNYGIFHSIDIASGQLMNYKGVARNAADFCASISEHLGYTPDHCGSWGT